MLKQVPYAKRRFGMGAGTGAMVRERLTPELVQSVVNRNPEFWQLDGILGGLATACLNNAIAGPLQLIGVCSGVSGEGKSTIALALAATLAVRADGQVLLIEGDLRTPSLADDLEWDRGPGLVDCLRGEVGPGDVIRRTSIDRLSVMIAGEPVEHPITQLSRESLPQLIEGLRDYASHIVVDIPAILERTEAGRLVELMQGVILVVQAGKLSRNTAEAAIAAIGRERLIGVVLNRVSRLAPGWLGRILSSDGALSPG